MFDRFQHASLDVGDGSIFARWAGTGPPVLLLHGFPETHLMWRDVAPLLTARFTVVCADLRGYGASSCPPGAPGDETYAKRAYARDMVRVMKHLGFERFSVAGHDRGGRVAYRLALDHPGRVDRLAVLDVVPTGVAFDRADARFALDYWPWSLLAQPAPLPERILASAGAAIVEHALDHWGDPVVCPEEVRAAYVEQLCDPRHAAAICNEYRAAASHDRAHDRDDLSHGRRIQCPVLALWSADGPLDTWYRAEGGPLALWKTLADDVSGVAVAGGHFFPETYAATTASALDEFFGGSQAP